MQSYTLPRCCEEEAASKYLSEPLLSFLFVICVSVRVPLPVAQKQACLSLVGNGLPAGTELATVNSHSLLAISLFQGSFVC